MTIYSDRGTKHEISTFLWNSSILLHLYFVFQRGIIIGTGTGLKGPLSSSFIITLLYSVHHLSSSSSSPLWICMLLLFCLFTHSLCPCKDPLKGHYFLILFLLTFLYLQVLHSVIIPSSLSDLGKCSFKWLIVLCTVLLTPVGSLRALDMVLPSPYIHTIFFKAQVTLQPWRWSQQVPQKHWYQSARPHDKTSPFASHCWPVLSLYTSVENRQWKKNPYIHVLSDALYHRTVKLYILVEW